MPPCSGFWSGANVTAEEVGDALHWNGFLDTDDSVDRVWAVGVVAAESRQRAVVLAVVPAVSARLEDIWLPNQRVRDSLSSKQFATDLQ